MSSMHGGVNKSNDPRWVVEAVRRIQDGDEVEGSFRLLFDHFEPQAARFLRGRGIDATTAEDLAQDAMVRVYRSIGRFRWDSSFNSWTLTLVTNVYKNHRRHLSTARPQAERTSLDALLEEHAEGERTELPESFAAPEADPREAALYAERKRQLAAAIEELPPRLRQSLLLRFQGFSYREIARILEVKSDTVKKHLTEARRRLRPLFDVVAVLVGLFGVFEGALRLFGPSGG